MTDDLTQLISKDRILMAAWMLPNEGALTDSQRRQALENFERYMRAHGLTPADVGRQLGKPRATTIGELLKGKYRDKADAYIRKLNFWVEQDARRRKAALADNFVSTKVARDMLTVARLVVENQTMGLVLGPTGIGKTRCALALRDKYVGSIYLRVMIGYHHPKGMTLALAGELGVRQTSSAHAAKHQTQLERVLDALADSNRLIMIDEAHALQDPAIELLRDIHDVAGAPILLLATRELHDRIVRNADPDRGQLYSRFDVIHHLTEGHDLYVDGKPLYTLDDVRALYDEPPVRLAPDAASFLQDVANQLGYGSLRRCKVLLRNAARRARRRQNLADGDQVTVTAEDLEWVETRLRQESGEQSMAAQRRQRAAHAVGS